MPSDTALCNYLKLGAEAQMLYFAVKLLNLLVLPHQLRWWSSTEESYLQFKKMVSSLQERYAIDK